MAKKESKTTNRIDKIIISKKEGDKYFKKVSEEANNIYNFINFQLRQINTYQRSKNDELLHESTLETIKHINKKVVEFNNRTGKNVEQIVRGGYMPNMTQGYAVFLISLIRDRDIEDFPDKINPFKQIQSGIAQSVVIDLVMENWKSYIASISSWSKDKSKYKSIPKHPNYKKKGGQSAVYMSRNAFSDKNGYVTIAKKTIGYTFKKSRPNDKLTQIRILPRYNHYVLEQVYQYEKDLEIAEKLSNKEINRCIALDPGINNLFTVTNNFNKKSFIINGRVVKSINQNWNKERAKAMSYIGGKGMSNRVARLDLNRNNKIHDISHKVSRYLVDYCVGNNVDTIIIGYNEGWKQNVSIGKRNNQNFVGIPFKKIMSKIEYKANEKGVKVIYVNESHTSKCDALALEKIGHHENYLGKRSKRGKFISSTGQMINADVNGSLNIMRRAVGNGVIDTIKNKHNLTPNIINVV